MLPLVNRIYQSVYQPNSRFLRPSRLALHRRSPLRTGRDHRRAHQRQQRRRPRFEQPMLTIHDRPFPVDDRSEAGQQGQEFLVAMTSLARSQRSRRDTMNDVAGP
jgi:IS30 family transposase